MRIHSRSRKNRRDERGQSLVEFALILPIVLVVVLIALDVGRAFAAVVALNNATRIAANYASLHPTAWTGSGNATYQAEYASLVTDDFAGMGCPAPNPVPPPTFPNGTSLGSSVSVTFSCTLPLITPVFALMDAFRGWFGGGRVAATTGIPIGATSVFAVRGGVIDIAPNGGGGSLAASFTATPTTGDAPLAVSLTDTSTGQIDTRYWDFGDGTVAYGNAGGHTYNSPGSYTISLTVSNSTSASEASTAITVNAPPAGSMAVDFSATPNPVQERSGVAFAGSVQGGTSPYTYTWDFGDGTTGTGSTASHSYSLAGTYTVSLSVTDAGGLAATATHPVTVTAVLCTVPSLQGTMTSQVQRDWTDAGFLTNVQFDPRRPPEYRVVRQTQSAGSQLPCATAQIQVSNP